MAIELITGRAGEPHVDSFDVGAFNATLFGSGVYVLSGVEATLVDANNVSVSAGELLCEGRHIRITGAGEGLAIDNGLSSYKRHDIIAAKYTRGEDGIEAVELVVIKGDNSTTAPSDPPMPTAGKLLDGASNVYWPLYRITIDGLTPQAPEKMAEDAPVITTEGENVLERLGAADHVIAEGLSDDWYYRKYASGWAECWKSHGFTAAMTNYGEGVYFCSAQKLTLPFNLSGAVANLSLSSYGHLTDVVFSMFDEYNPSHELTFYAKSGISISIFAAVQVYVLGRWK